MDSPKPLEVGEVKAHLKKLVQQTLQEALEGELDEFLGYQPPAENHPTAKSLQAVPPSSIPLPKNISHK